MQEIEDQPTQNSVKKVFQQYVRKSFQCPSPEAWSLSDLETGGPKKEGQTEELVCPTGGVALERGHTDSLAQVMQCS
jgi:hypothetical protein